MRRYNNPYLILLAVLLIYMGPGQAFISGGIAGAAKWLMDTLYMLPAIIIGLSFHEFGHAFAADRFGDPTPRLQGRLSLDPKAHVDLTGLISLVFIHFGWGRPVIINPANFRNRHLGCIAVSLAGIVMNFLLAVIFGGILKLFIIFGGSFLYTDAAGIIWNIILEVIVINLSLMLFNLLPVPPLDGYNFFGELFNLSGKGWYRNIYQYSTLILLAVIFFDIPSRLLTAPLNTLVNFILFTLFRM